MNILFTDSIIISPSRQRKKFDETKLLELQESIIQNGLLHPIVVRTTPEGFVLVAGERRMRAIADAHALGQPVRIGPHIASPGQWPVVDIGALDEDAAYEAELEENIQRDDLTWQEKAAATARLHELRTLQATRRGDKAPTHNDIAEEIHGQRDAGFGAIVHRDLTLARNLSNPEIAKSKSPKEAMKILKNQEQRKKHAALAKAIGTTFSSKDHTLLKGNCLDLISTLQPASFDCLLTDPPYGMGANEFGDSGGLLPGQHHYEDSHESWVELMSNFIKGVSVLMKPQAHAYVFCDIERFPELKKEFELCEWKVFRTPLIWVNPKGRRIPWPDRGPQRKYQTCLYAIRGNRNTLKFTTDVLTYPSDLNEGHAAQKPVELIKDLLSSTCRPGDKVLDPFVGSGSIFPAAHALKIKATGIELDESAYGLASKRLGDLS